MAYRGNQRWIQTFEPQQYHLSTSQETLVRQGGTYLIIGGGNDQSIVLTDYLTQFEDVTLAFVHHRHTVPPHSEWEHWLMTHEIQDTISRWIVHLQSLEQRGVPITMVSEDIRNTEYLQSAIEHITQQHGAINGVFYIGSGDTSTQFCALHEIQTIDDTWFMRQHAQELSALADVLQDYPVDFCVLFSSLTAVLGGLGLVNQTVASLLTDAFAHQCNQTHPSPWMSINWDIWHWEIAHGSKPQQHLRAAAMLSDLAITPHEGTVVLDHILRLHAPPQLVISTGDLQLRLQHRIPTQCPVDHHNAEGSGAQHPRPMLQTVYVAPERMSEQHIVDIWQGLLGIEQIGIHDDFFELGGHSLLATQLLSRLRDVFKIDIPLQTLFEKPTVAELASYIEQQQIEQSDQEMLAQMLTELEQLSSDEIMKVLTTEKQLQQERGGA